MKPRRWRFGHARVLFLFPFLWLATVAICAIIYIGIQEPSATPGELIGAVVVAALASSASAAGVRYYFRSYALLDDKGLHLFRNGREVFTSRCVCVFEPPVGPSIALRFVDYESNETALLFTLSGAQVFYRGRIRRFRRALLDHNILRVDPDGEPCWLQLAEPLDNAVTDTLEWLEAVERS